MCNAHNHPPVCTCGWGGEGHAGSSSGRWSYTSPTTTYRPSVTHEWRERDFTRPSRCPECGANVFFIRHNGGFVWIDPPLGPPWDKHGCFDEPTGPTSIFSAWSPKTSGLTNPVLAIIKSIKTFGQGDESLVEVEFTDATRASLILRWTPNDDSLAGSLVFISEEDRLLLHRQHAEIPFHSFSRIPPAGSDGWYTCPRCKLLVRYGTGHEEDCRTLPSPNTNRPPPPNPPASPNRTRPWNLPPHRRPVVDSSAVPNDSLNPTVIRPSVAPLQLPRLAGETLEAHTRRAVAFVAEQVWVAVAGIHPPGEQLRCAKQKAVELIAMLSPSIKRKVRNAFTSAKWQPLASRRPKN